MQILCTALLSQRVNGQLDFSNLVFSDLAVMMKCMQRTERLGLAIRPVAIVWKGGLDKLPSDKCLSAGC